jgi:2-dehydropantoate 2-reductase
VSLACRQGASADRVAGVVSCFSHAGFDCVASRDIHSDIWNKAVSNSVMNPVSAMTGATCDRILDDPLLSDFFDALTGAMSEIGRAVGAKTVQIDALLGLARALGRSKGLYATQM